MKAHLLEIAYCAPLVTGDQNIDVRSSASIIISIRFWSGDCMSTRIKQWYDGSRVTSTPTFSGTGRQAPLDFAMHDIDQNMMPEEDE